jgi:hypothetical protein
MMLGQEGGHHHVTGPTIITELRERRRPCIEFVIRVERYANRVCGR